MTVGEQTKRPASQYYWGDWHRDVALQSCSLVARGLWHEMNCLMHQGEPYGHLTMPNGKAMTMAQLANLTKITGRECERLVHMLEEAGVFSRTADGVIYSRRMVRDEAIRSTRAKGGAEGAEHGVKGAAHGAKGGRPKRSKGGSETPLDDSRYPPPSSSTSSSSSASPHSEPDGSGGEPPAGLGLDMPPVKTPEEEKAALWRSAVVLLGDQGVDEKQARAFIGKLHATHKADPALVGEAVRITVAEQPGDARGFLMATCQRLAGERKAPNRQEALEQRNASTMGEWAAQGATHETV